jgi:phage gp46-like protein
MSTSWSYFLPSASTGSSAGSGSAAITKPRRWIDAATKDFLVEGGDYKQDDGFTSKVVLALGTKLGTCQANPKLGSRLHEIQKVDDRGRRLAESYALMAVQHLSGEIKDLKVTAELDKKYPGAIFITVSGRKGTQAVFAKYTAKV